MSSKILRYKTYTTINKDIPITEIVFPIKSNGLYLFFTMVSGDLISNLKVIKTEFAWFIYIENYYNIDKVIEHLKLFLIEEK